MFIKHSYVKRLLIIIILFSSSFGFSQLSKTHYIPPLTESGESSSAPQDHYIYISTPSNSNVSFTIRPVGLPATSYVTGIVSKNTPFVYTIGTGRNTQLFVNANESSTIKTNKGYIIEAQSVVYVSVRVNAGAQAGALVSKGLAALGTVFRVGSFTNENPQSNYLNFVSVMATEDNTQVSFSSLPAGLIIENYSGTTPVNISLNKGESYTLATNSNNAVVNRDGLIGCLVNSDKPIVVNCGSANGSFHNGGARDYGIDQIVDLSKVGTEYIFVKGDGSDGWENVLIVANTNNTSVSINGGAPVATINAGDYYLIEGGQYSASGNMYVQTSQPAFAYQGVGATNSEANQGMFFVPPLSCETRGNLDNIAFIQTIGSTIYTGGISIVTKVGATVTINNLPLSNFTAIGPNNVPGKTDYVTYKVLNLSGNVSVESTDELYCAYFNFNGAATSGSFYSGFPSPPEINFGAVFTTLGNCIPNVTLEVANAGSFDSFEWFFDDGSGSGFQTTNISTLQFTPTQPGKYKLIGLLNCTNTTLESLEVPISICPDDIDNDGIIDNIDIDNDNDGILNCTESKGDVILDLSNTSPPILRFQDGTVNSTIATNNIILNRSSGNTSSMGLTSTGNIISIIPPDSNAENEYNIAFNESVNIKFSEDISVTHTIVNDEFFVAKILPVNKNITLVDPNNRLLVDSNFDGIYEAGVTVISGSEIRFKINPAPTGNIPYTFLANQVDGFSLIHKLNNTVNTSIFTGNISLTCYKNDNDFDGIDDSLDLDSDNDGIPDFIENTGVLLPLSGIDVDNNGLDDVYNLLGIPLDSDSDSVPDFYDLDSDNDGIYDIYESGSSLLDTNFDGIIDNVLTNIGINGWDDNAETTPDSNLIGYTLNDLDVDNIFSYMDADSDGDGCNDVIEAGFSDGNNDTFLGDILPITNTLGIVTNALDGYTLPNSDYLTAAPIIITTQPINTEVCELENTTISLASTTFTTIQWEVSTDGITWNSITNNVNYNNSQTLNLTLNNVPLSFNNYQYRARLERLGNSCGLYSDSMILTVLPQPIVTPLVVLVQCDDDDLTTLGFSPFNLTEANNEISTNAANQTFTYFLTQFAAISGDITSSDFINNPTTFINRTISNDAIWARIENNTGCANVSQIQLNVSTTVIPSSFLVTFNQCDDFLDINGLDNVNNNDRDGIATFNFSSVSATILSFIPPGQNPLPPRYFRNEADALAEENEITDISNYRNIGYPSSQLIYIRVDSNIANDCLGLGAHILLNVEPLPIANPVTITRQCDDDNDGQFPFNTSQIQNDLLGSQNPANVTVTYFDQNGNALPSPLPNPFLTASQIITIRVTNNISSAPDGPCFDETTLEFIVDASPVANPISAIIVCDGSVGDIDNDGEYPFNTSNFTNTILGTQTGMDIFYNYTDETGALVRSQTLPNPLNSGNQTIMVDVINPINTTCTASINIDLIVNPLPDFTIETPQIVCSSDPTFTVVLDPLEANNSESFTYEWINKDTGTFLSNATTLSVSTPGTYSITLTKADGTNCSRTRDVFVNASELATITQDDITIVDISENNTITINENNLGLGDYEYALDDEFSFYQDEPFFERVKAGFHRLYVRDKKGCGTTFIDISVIGYPKFFTPNNDGFNDYWQILGVNSQFQAESIIYIFDRYGKLLKQVTTNSTGWDGTFNGAQMQTDDYWFRVKLEDGREFSGHFTLKR